MATRSGVVPAAAARVSFQYQWLALPMPIQSTAQRTIGLWLPPQRLVFPWYESSLAAWVRLSCLGVVLGLLVIQLMQS